MPLRGCVQIRVLIHFVKQTFLVHHNIHLVIWNVWWTRICLLIFGLCIAFIQTYYIFFWGGGGTAAAAPPPFRPSDPALCGSCPLVTPYYCRLGDLLCYSCLLFSFFCVCMNICNLCFHCVFCVIFFYSFLLQYFDTVGWVFWPVKTVSHITYTVLEGT